MKLTDKNCLSENHKQKRQQLGKLGEDIAVNFLKSQGYKIIERNFQKRYGEIDIIATRNQTLVFIEVKTRIGNEYGPPEEAVTQRKIREIIKTSQYYVLTKPNLSELQRIDVIAIDLDENKKIRDLRHIENVTF